MKVPAGYDIETAINRVRLDGVKAIERNIEAIKQNLRIAQIADAYGWEHNWSIHSTWSVDVHVPAHDLTKARKIFGKLTHYGTQVSDAERRLVRVRLGCDAWPQLRIEYEKSLPEDAKCKIVTRTESDTYHALVCSR